MIRRRIKNKKLRKQKTYSEEMRKFALTLQFYSSRAYDYVRKTWKNLLPHPSTIRNWYSVVNGKPGFTKEAFGALKSICEKKTAFCNIVIDEMKIKEEIVYSGNKFYGVVDMGTELTQQDEGATKASYALVFMAVAINGHWKIPLGYFLIKSLTGQERCNLVLKCFELMHESGAVVHSITFDGAATNLSMSRHLGANLNIFSPNFKPWFTNPSSGEKILIFLDACHMIKLVRNTLGDWSVLKTDGKKIEWKFIENLIGIQKKEGLHAANKLTTKHIKFNENRMNVKLAVQTLSSSTSKALTFCRMKGYEDFQNSEATSEFCEIFNNAFDILNVRNKFSKKNSHNIALKEDNLRDMAEKANVIIEYIKNLKDEEGNILVQGKRKTGFSGIIIDLMNITQLFTILSRKGLEYLLSFKLSQDLLETFFSAIRSRGGFNNNPNAKQFESAYKRLLVKNEISTSNSNCLADGIEILRASSRRSYQEVIPIGDEEELTNIYFDHDYMKTIWGISPFVDDVVNYIGGFVVGKLIKKRIVTCDICIRHLTMNDTTSTLINLKNRGPFLYPSKDVIHICEVSENMIRCYKDSLFNNPQIINFLTTQIMQWVNHQVTFESREMDSHIKSQDIFENHKIILVKLIIKIYLKVRMHHESKVVSEKNKWF